MAKMRLVVSRQGGAPWINESGSRARDLSEAARQRVASRPGSGAIGLRQVEGIPDAFELVHPRCVAEAELDYQEGIDLWKAGDPEEARDALRYALGACRDNLWVHVALGQLALREFKDPALRAGISATRSS